MYETKELNPRFHLRLCNSLGRLLPPMSMAGNESLLCSDAFADPVLRKLTDLNKAIDLNGRYQAALKNVERRRVLVHGLTKGDEFLARIAVAKNASRILVLRKPIRQVLGPRLTEPMKLIKPWHPRFNIATDLIISTLEDSATIIRPLPLNEAVVAIAKTALEWFVEMQVIS